MVVGSGDLILVKPLESHPCQISNIPSMFQEETLVKLIGLQTHWWDVGGGPLRRRASVGEVNRLVRGMKGKNGFIKSLAKCTKVSKLN